MRRDFLRLVRRYGSEAALKENGVETLGMAFLQPMRDKEEKLLPTALGRREQGKVLCLCESGLAPEKAGEDARLSCDGKVYRILTAHPICFGGENIFCWAVLLPDDEEETV